MQIMKARLESAQHILQQILEDEYQATSEAKEVYDENFRLVMKSPLDLTAIPKEEIEKKVNAVIQQNLPVVETIYQRSEVPSNVDLSMLPESVKEIRVVTIGDFDSTACHHLHVSQTSEIGTYKLVEVRKDGKDTYKFISQVT